MGETGISSSTGYCKRLSDQLSHFLLSVLWLFRSSVIRPDTWPAPQWSFRSGAKLITLLALVLIAPVQAQNEPPNKAETSDSDLTMALLMADVLRAARSEIASQQPNINNALVGNKGLSGAVIIERILARLDEAGKPDPKQFSDGSRENNILNSQLAAIEEIIDENQILINKKGIGFKGFVPAVFAQLSNERFSEKMDQIAEIKVTAPIQLVRNRKARPDKWERSIIESKFLAADWSRGELYSELTTDENNNSAFRVMVPEYYGEACLACHGSPSGELDVTGYPKEGGELDDLGGAISVTLYK